MTKLQVPATLPYGWQFPATFNVTTWSKMGFSEHDTSTLNRMDNTHNIYLVSGKVKLPFMKTATDIGNNTTIKTQALWHFPITVIPKCKKQM